MRWGRGQTPPARTEKRKFTTRNLCGRRMQGAARTKCGRPPVALSPDPLPLHRKRRPIQPPRDRDRLARSNRFDVAMPTVCGSALILHRIEGSGTAATQFFCVVDWSVAAKLGLLEKAAASCDDSAVAAQSGSPKHI